MNSLSIPAYKDENHEGNSSKYHTGNACVEKGCSRPAGTWWSPLWCMEHNVERMSRVSEFLVNEIKRLEGQ
jgi:hypothetical protein